MKLYYLWLWRFHMLTKFQWCGFNLLYTYLKHTVWKHCLPDPICDPQPSTTCIKSVFFDKAGFNLCVLCMLDECLPISSFKNTFGSSWYTILTSAFTLLRALNRGVRVDILTTNLFYHLRACLPVTIAHTEYS